MEKYKIEEDMKVIFKLREYIKLQKKELNMFGYITTLEVDLKNTEKVLNLLEKQNEYIKQLEEENKKMVEEYLVNNPGMVKYLKDNYIFKSKVKEKIEELDNKRRKFTSDNVNNFYLQEFTRKYTQKSDHDYGVFGTPETITYCINNELLGRIEVLQELLALAKNQPEVFQELLEEE